jgi:hypothetical protein
MQESEAKRCAAAGDRDRTSASLLSKRTTLNSPFCSTKQEQDLAGDRFALNNYQLTQLAQIHVFMWQRIMWHRHTAIPTVRPLTVSRSTLAHFSSFTGKKLTSNRFTASLVKDAYRHRSAWPLERPEAHLGFVYLYTS